MGAINQAAAMLNLMESAVGDVDNLLSRGRELATQANNGTYSTTDLTQMQTEMDQIILGIDQIAEQVDFNGLAILKAGSIISVDGAEEVFEKVKEHWIEGSLSKIKEQYGLDAAGANLSVEYSELDGAGGTIASLSTNGSNSTLFLDSNDVTGDGVTSGGTAPHYFDRYIADELVEFTQTHNIAQYSSIPDWLKSGSKELLTGGDEQLKTEITNAGGNAKWAVVRDKVGNGSDESFDSSNSAAVSSAFVATRFLHNQIESLRGNWQPEFEDGGKEGVGALLYHMAQSGDDFITALQYATEQNRVPPGGDPLFSDSRDVIVAYLSAMNGLPPGYGIGAGNAAGIVLTDLDVGAIGGKNADLGSPSFLPSAESVIPDGTPLTTDQIESTYNIGTLSYVEGLYSVSINLGEDSGSSFDLKDAIADVRTSILGVDSANVTSGASAAITAFDNAIATLGSQRATIGAYMNRLDSILTTTTDNYFNHENAVSRMVDADMATAASQTTRELLLQKSAVQGLKYSMKMNADVVKLVGLG